MLLSPPLNAHRMFYCSCRTSTFCYCTECLHNTLPKCSIDVNIDVFGKPFVCWGRFRPAEVNQHHLLRQAPRGHIQSQALKHNNSCDIPRALYANTQSTSHDKPCYEACGHLRSAERFAAHHTGGSLGGGAWGGSIEAKHPRSADHSWSKGHFDVCTCPNCWAHLKREKGVINGAQSTWANKKQRRSDFT